MEIINLFFIPLVVTILGTMIYEIIRNRKKDYKISCEIISLRQYRERESDNLRIAISYKNENVGDSLCVIALKLINTGRKDIAFNQVFEDKIEIFHNEYKIIDIVVEEQSDRVSAEISNSNTSKWLLSWGILKKKEFIVLKIVAIIEKGKPSDDYNWIIKNIDFKFRGNNINRIDIISSHNDRVLTFLTFLLCLLMIVAVVIVPTRNKVRYNAVVNNVEYKDVYIKYNSYTNLYLLSKEGKPICKTTEFDSLTVSSQKLFNRSYIRMFFSVLSYMLFIIAYIYALKRSKIFYLVDFEEKDKNKRIRFKSGAAATRPKDE